MTAPCPSANTHLRMTMFCDGVLTRRPSPVGVLARLDGDAVVAGVEATVLDHDVVAAFGVAAVVVRAVAVDRDVLHRHGRAEHGVDLPHRRPQYGHVGDNHVLAPVGLDEHRAQVVPGAEHALVHRHAVVGHFLRELVISVLVRLALMPPELGLALPRPPVRVVCLPVECARAGDADVSLLEGVDERRVVHQFDALPTRLFAFEGVAAGASRPG